MNANMINKMNTVYKTAFTTMTYEQLQEALEQAEETFTAIRNEPDSDDKRQRWEDAVAVISGYKLAIVTNIAHSEAVARMTSAECAPDMSD